jgi:hypothetical protein
VQLGEDETHGGIAQRQAAALAQRAIERLVHEAQHLGLVGHREAGIEIGLERKLAQQRQAERVDGADGNLAESLAQLAPARLLDLAALARLAQLPDDPLAHLGGGLAREGDREDVPRVDPCLQQVDVPVHEHARLARSCRGLEHDVAARVDGGRAVGRIRQLRCRRPVDVKRQPGRLLARSR